MEIFRFRKFVIYQQARAFRKIVQKELKDFPREEKYRLIDQIHRSTLSILLNIAEGSAKGTDKAFANFLDIAISSVSEVIAGFDAAFDDGILSEERRNDIEKAGSLLARHIGSFLQILRPRSMPRTTTVSHKLSAPIPLFLLCPLQRLLPSLCHKP